jgi:hypothetical protein
MRALAAVALAALVATTGCTQYCGATPEKLASLRPGMSYQETVAIMGCPGDAASTAAPASGEMSSLLWNGPDSVLFNYTQVEFFDGRLLWYTTVSKGGY